MIYSHPLQRIRAHHHLNQIMMTLNLRLMKMMITKNKIKKIHVTEEQFGLLSRGRLGITRLSGGFVLIPVEVAEKVRERAPHWPVHVAEVSKQPMAEDDPYAAYQIPDDLMW